MDQKRPLRHHPAQMPPPPHRSSGSSSSASTAQPSELPSSPEDRRVQKAKIDESSSSKGRRNRSSAYKGVTRHKWSGRYEAHLWDKTCPNPTQTRMGRQVYLGVFDDEDAAAHAHDLAVIKFIGKGGLLNFPIHTYEEHMEVIERLNRDEFLSWIKRGSGSFARGTSKYRGVFRHTRDDRWEARIGGLDNRKYLYLGVYDTEEKAAQAYDRAALHYRGVNAVTNFHPGHYLHQPALPSPMPRHQRPQQHVAAEHHVRPPPPSPHPRLPDEDRPQQYSRPSPLPQPACIFHIPRTTGLAKPVPPPPDTAAADGVAAGERRLPAQPYEKIHREAAALLDEMAGGIYITDVPPSGLCMDPTGFDPFPAPVMAIEPESDGGNFMAQWYPGSVGGK